MKVKDIDDLIKIVEVISQINIPNYIISINSNQIIKTLEEVKLILPDVVVSEAECCDICKEESRKGNKVNKICANCIKENY